MPGHFCIAAGDGKALCSEERGAIQRGASKRGAWRWGAAKRGALISAATIPSAVAASKPQAFLEVRRAAAHAARMMKQTPAPRVAAPGAVALADTHAGNSALTHAFLGSAWYRARAEGAESPERLSVRAGMQALAQACAAATVPVLPTPHSVAQVKRSESGRSGSWPLVLSCSPSMTTVCGKRVGVRCLPARQRCQAIFCSIACVMGGTRCGLWREATTGSRAWISTRPLHLYVHTAHCV